MGSIGSGLPPSLNGNGYVRGQTVARPNPVQNAQAVAPRLTEKQVDDDRREWYKAIDEGLKPPHSNYYQAQMRKLRNIITQIADLELVICRGKGTMDTVTSIANLSRAGSNLLWNLGSAKVRVALGNRNGGY